MRRALSNYGLWQLFRNEGEALLTITADLMPQHGSLLGFDGFTFDITRGVLTVEAREVVLRPKTAAVLEHLLAHAGKVVSRDALMFAVWGDLSVTDDNLTQCVSEIRRALGTGGANVLRTHARRGYMMATRLHAVAPAALPGAVAPQVMEPDAGLAWTPPTRAEAPKQATDWRSRMITRMGLIAGGCLLLLVIAGMIVDRTWGPAPKIAASDKLSTWEQAERLVQQGHLARNGVGTREERLRASLPWFLRALALEPRMAEAAAEAAFVHVNLRTIGASQDREQDLREAQRLAALAMAAKPNAPLSLAAHAAVLRQERRFAEALVFYQRAGADPSRVIDRANVGVMHLLLGAPEAAQLALRAALRESPRREYSGTWRGYLGLAKLLAGYPAEAAGDFPMSNGGFFPADERLLYRLVALRAAGRMADADALDADLRQRYPAPLVRPLRAIGLSDEPAYRALLESVVLTPLRQIGWIEPGR
jgi:DNA-binding winged helix-turn-helix (wHTH) protein/tetratricopeptide (TPR) repeat protein